MTDDINNEGIDAMDEMESRLSLMGIGESAYYILLGAQIAGASIEEARVVLTAWFVAAQIANPTQEEENEQVDDD